MSGLTISSVVSVLVSGGLGVTIGSIGAAVIQAFTHKSENRAHAADLVADAAGNLADRLSKANDKYDADNKVLRGVILVLTDSVDEALCYANPPQVIPASVMTELKRSNNDAKKAI